LWFNNTDCLCFPCAACELPHSSDLALLTKPGNFAKGIWQPCICQPNEIKREIKKKLWGGAKQKSWGAMAHPAAP